MRSVSEKRFVDVEKFNMQADFLAESGANHALSELRERIGVDLDSGIGQITDTATIHNYYTSDDAVGFLEDYAGFTVDGSEATLTLTPLTLITEVDGSYNAEIIITSAAAVENPGSDSYVFYYDYVVRGIGTSTAISPNIVKQVSLTGSFSVNVIRDNFARYALFTDHHTSPSGGTVWFTDFTNYFGPVHTNERFSFAYNPSASFTGEATQAFDTARFYNDRSPILLDDDNNADIDVPIFDVGFERGVQGPALQASIDPDSVKQQALGTAEEPGVPGVYVPILEGAVTGGIYSPGPISSLVIGTAGSQQCYTVQQGGTTTVITTDYGANTTTVQVGGDINTYTGIPDGKDDEGILFYSGGNIENLSGTVPAGVTATIASEGDIIITGHIRYQNYNHTKPISATGYTNMLGILSFGGDIRIGANAPKNIDIHATIMAPAGIFTVDDYTVGKPRGTATVLGSIITSYYGPFGTFYGGKLYSGYGRNFVYDERVLLGQTPPYFIYMTNFVASDYGLDDRPLWRKD